jgi:hypothetical protein
MFAILNKNNQYLTRKGINSNLSFTDNQNFAYTYKDKSEAKRVKIMIESETGENLKVIEIN